MKRGLFIVFEGCDRVGKSTQSKLMVEKIESMNMPAKLICFPNRECVKTGAILDAYLKGDKDALPLNLKCGSPLKIAESAHALFSENRRMMQDTIKEYLQAGTSVVSDRYSYSGAAYSMAQGMDLQACLDTETGYVQPDIVMFISAHIDNLTSRGGFGEERYEKAEFQRKVSEAFTEVIHQFRLRATIKTKWIIVNGLEPIDNVTKFISTELDTYIRQLPDSLEPIQYL